VEVSNNKVSLLTNLAELGSGIDRARVQRAAEAAQELLRNEHDAEAVAAISRAHARLAASGGFTGSTGWKQKHCNFIRGKEREVKPWSARWLGLPPFLMLLTRRN